MACCSRVVFVRQTGTREPTLEPGCDERRFHMQRMCSAARSLWLQVQDECRPGATTTKCPPINRVARDACIRNDTYFNARALCYADLPAVRGMKPEERVFVADHVADRISNQTRQAADEHAVPLGADVRKVITGTDLPRQPQRGICQE